MGLGYCAKKMKVAAAEASIIGQDNKEIAFRKYESNVAVYVHFNGYVVEMVTKQKSAPLNAGPSTGEH